MKTCTNRSPGFTFGVVRACLLITLISGLLLTPHNIVQAERAGSPQQWDFPGWRLPLPAGRYMISQGDAWSSSSNYSHDFSSPYLKCAIDIVMEKSGAIAGTPVLSPVDGRVMTASYTSLNGYYAKVVADDGKMYAVLHMQAKTLAVKAGDRVVQGQPLGRVGSTGNSTAAHLHFVVLTDSKGTDCVRFDQLDGNSDLAYHGRTSAGKAVVPITSSNQQVGNDPPTTDGTPINPQPAPDNKAPNRPDPASPNDWAVTTDGRVTLCARENGDPDSGDRVSAYRFEIYQSAQTWDSGWGSSPCVTTTPLSPYNFQWHVKVRDTHNAESEWSTPWHFTVQQAVPVSERVTLLSPSNGQAVSTQDAITLRWNPAANAVRYQVEVWGGPYSTMRPCDGTSSTSCAIGTLYSGEINWHVRSFNASGTASDWSEAWTFKVQSPQTPTPVVTGKPGLVSPGNGDTYSTGDEITLRWNRSDNAATYRVEVWGGPYSSMTPCSGTTSDSCFIGRMQSGQIQWHVRAVSASGQESDWSDTWTFKIEAPTPPAPVAPGRPTLASPANGQTLTTGDEVLLRWNPADNAISYRVEMWGGPYSGMTPCTGTGDINCPVGTMYAGQMQWRVRAVSQDGLESDWSDTWSFSVVDPAPPAPQKPSLSSPGNGQTLSTTDEIGLRWNPAANAVAYRVELWGGPYTTMIPCDGTGDTTCFIGRMWPGEMFWKVVAINTDGAESDWSDTWSFRIQEPATPQPPTPEPPTPEPPRPEPPQPEPQEPGYIEVVDDLRLYADGGGSPQAGVKLIAHYRIRNGGDLPLEIEYLGVRGRKDGQSWDIGFTPMTLSGGQEWGIDQNNERPLEPGNYSFRISYKLAGGDWQEIGTEINFTIP